MMLFFFSDTQQDTIPGKNVAIQDTVRIADFAARHAAKKTSDSVFEPEHLQAGDSVQHKIVQSSKPGPFVYADTTLVCTRNNIIDITFNDSTDLLTLSEPPNSAKFPFVFVEKNRLRQEKKHTSLAKHLKSGSEIPPQPLHDDWIIGIIFLVVLLYSIILTTSKDIFPGAKKFFTFRGITDYSSSHDSGDFFHWQSTLKNFISFMIIGLFIYSACSFYGIIPSGINGILIWIIAVGIVISAITLRHFVCYITGNASGERDAFREYLTGIYQTYRFSALLLFIIIIMMFYTVFFSVKAYLLAGIVVMGIMYLIRIIRLMIIFLNRNISIFYLILYLCALEILPVLVSVKYFTNLV